MKVTVVLDVVNCSDSSISRQHLRAHRVLTLRAQTRATSQASRIRRTPSELTGDVEGVAGNTISVAGSILCGRGLLLPVTAADDIGVLSSIRRCGVLWGEVEVGGVRVNHQVGLIEGAVVGCTLDHRVAV